MSKLSTSERICIELVSKLQEALNHHYFIDITNLQPDGSGCSSTHYTKVIKTLGFKYFDQYEGSVSNNLQSLDIMKTILNPPEPHSAILIAQRNITEALTAARRYDYFIDVTNLQEDGTGWIKVELGKRDKQYSCFYYNCTLHTCGSISQMQSDARCCRLACPTLP